MSRLNWSFLLLSIIISSISGSVVKAQPKAKVTKKHNLEKEENIQIEKEIKALREDYKIFKNGVFSISKTASYLVKRSKRNERVALEEQIHSDTKKAKVKDIIERARLLKLLELRLSKYKKHPNKLWTPELLWRTAVLYHEMAEEREIWIIKEDDETGKVLAYEDDYQQILNDAYKLSKGLIRPADSSLGVGYFRKKAEANLKELIIKYPKFRAIGSAYHLLARIYEKPPFSDQDAEKLLPATVSLSAVCSNWGYKPFKNKFKSVLIKKGSDLLSPLAFNEYKKWEITDFPAKLPFDPFAACKTVSGSTEFIGTAWATLGKFLSTKMLEFKKVTPEMNEEQATNVKLFNLALTKWAALSAYKRALGPEYKNLSTRGYVVYFAALMMYQNELNQALAMKLFDKVVKMGQDLDKNSPHEAAIKYIGFLLQEERIDDKTGDTKYSWKAPYPIKCEDKCPVRKLALFFKGKNSEPHVKRIWLGVADFFRGFEGGKLYQRSEEDLLFAYDLYDYIFRKMDLEGGWRYNPAKPSIFWKMRELILLQITNYQELLTQVKSRRDKNSVRKKLAYWKKKKTELYSFAPNVVFRSQEIEKFLTEHQKFLLINNKRRIKLKTIALKDLRRDIINIKSFTLLSTGEVLADRAKDLFFKMKNASGAEKERLRKITQKAFDKAVGYFKDIMKDYPNSIFEYGAMVRVLNFYCELPMATESKKGEKKKVASGEPHYYLIDLKTNEQERKKVIYEALRWGRKVRDSHLGTDWRKNAAVIINSIYVDRLAYKDPKYPFDYKNDKGAKVEYKKQEIPEKFNNYIKDASIYMKMYPKDKNSSLFLYKIARIYLHYLQIEKARKLYRLILKKYCSSETAYYASYDIFLTYKFQKVPAAQEKDFADERSAAIKDLQRHKCGGDEKHRELMDMIAKLELNQLVKTSDKVFNEADKAKKQDKSDPEKWKKALTYYEQLKRKMEARKPAKKELKEYYQNMFGIYWKIYICKKELEDYQGAVEVLEKIRKKVPIFEIAIKKGYKELIFYQLAEAYTKSFDDVNALSMWEELTKTGARGTWLIRKKDKIKKASESQFRIMAEEKIFWIYRSRGEKNYRKIIRQGKKLISEFNIKNRMYKKVFKVNETTAYKELAEKMGVKESSLVKYYLMGWQCSGGNCNVTVTDKSVYYKEILFNLQIGKAFDKGSDESTLNSALKKVKDMEETYESYLPLSRIFSKNGSGANAGYTTSKAYEPMWKTRMNLIYRKASIWKRIMRKSRTGSTGYVKAREKYREMLKSYRKLFDKHLMAKPQLNPGYAIINYGEALIDYIHDKYKTVDNPFKGKTTKAIEVYQNAQIALVALQKKVSGQGADLQKKVKAIQDKIAKRQQEYIAEVKEYIEALQKIQGHQNGSKKLSQKDLLKYYKKYKKYSKKYPKFLKDLGKLGVNGAISKLISEQKDIKRMGKKLEKLSKGWSKSYPASTKAFFKKYIPEGYKSLKSVEKVYEGRDLAILKTIKKTLKSLETLGKTKKNLDFNDLAQIIQPLGQLALLSVMLPSNDVVELTFVTGQSLGQRADGYSWYKEQKGYLRKQVAKIDANLLALKINLLYQGIKIFEKAPYLKKLALVEYDENKDAKLKESGCTGKSSKLAKECYLRYKRKMYYKRGYTIFVGNKKSESIIVPLDKLIDEYNKTFKKMYSIMKAEKISSKIIRKAYNDYSRFNKVGGVAPIVEPKLEKISY